MSKSNLKFCDAVVPAAGTHAMDKVCVGLEWSTPLDHALMTELSASVQGKSLGLPRKIEITSGAVLQSASDNLPEALDSVAELKSIVFDDNTDKDSPADKKDVELLIRREGLLFTIQNSVGLWEETRQRAEKIFGLLFGIINKHREFSTIGLMISNSFSIRDRSVGVGQILNQQSEYLPRRVFQGGDFWRLDDDYYSSEGVDVCHLNLDASLMPAADSRDLSIITLQRYKTQSGSIESVEHFFDKLETLYGRHVTLVRSLVNDDVRDLIGMNGSER